MNNQIPKAVKVEMMSTFLKIEFDNGVIKYLKSHLNKEHAEAYSMKKVRRKMYFWHLMSLGWDQI